MEVINRKIHTNETENTKKETDLENHSRTKPEDAEHNKVPDLSYFQAQSGEFVLHIAFGSSNNYTDLFWKALKRGLRVWDKSLMTRLSLKSIPESPEEIHRLIHQLNQSAARTGDIIFVFSNFHYLKDGRIKNLIDNLYETAFDQISFVLTTTHHINVRVAGKIHSTSRENYNMQLTREEIYVYYTSLGIVLDHPVLETVYEITSGWVGAVRLLGNHLKREERLTETSFDIAYTYMHESMMRGFIKYERKVQHALLCLALLESFTTLLAVEATALSNYDLHDIFEHNQLILVNQNGESHHFHPLYRQFLLNNQIYLSREQKEDFFHRAAQWYERHESFIKALSYYTESRKYQQILPVLQKISVQLLKPDFAVMVADLLGNLPDNVMMNNPELRFYLFLSLDYAGSKRESLYLLDDIQYQLECQKRTASGDSILGEIYLTKAISFWRSSPSQYASLMKMAYELLPEGSRFLDDDKLYSAGGSILRFENLEPGGLLQTKEMLLGSISYSKKLLPHTGIGRYYLAAAEAHLYRAELEKAGEYAGMAVEEAYSTRDWGVICESYYLLLRISMSDGKLDDLLFYQEQIERSAKNLSSSQACFVVDITHLHMRVYLGVPHLIDKNIIKNLMKTSQLDHNPNIGRELYARARYLTDVVRQYTPAITCIDSAIPICHANGRWFSELKLILLKAVIYGIKDQKQLAVKYLVEAYERSAGNNILFPFIEFEHRFVELVHTVRKHIPAKVIPSDWLDQVTSEAVKYGSHKKELAQEYLHRNPNASMRRLGQLSEKEYLTMRYLCQGLSTEQIAQEMGVQPSTIYIYLHKIYQKFATEDRKEAIDIAISEGILE